MNKGDGISLSPYQIARAKEFTQQANLTSKLTYQVADALKMPFPDNTYDMTWSMESGEHMPDKMKFMNELVRVTAPGGRVNNIIFFIIFIIHYYFYDCHYYS
jgi:tocopherol O-methyltransferase